MEYLPLTNEEENIGKIIINSCFTVHKALGPGLLEKVYEACLEHEIKKSGLKVLRQVNIPIEYDGIKFEEGLQLDLLVDDCIIIELKAVETINPLWEAQIISHLKLMDLQLGYLVNFNVPLMKQGIKRFRV